MGVKAICDGWSLSGASVSGLTGSAIDLRGSNGNFFLAVSAGQSGPSGGASATFFLQHSIDLTTYTNIGVIMTASSTGVANPWLTASYSAGAYSYVRLQLASVFSAAQTGTAILAGYILGGTQ